MRGVEMQLSSPKMILEDECVYNYKGKEINVKSLCIKAIGNWLCCWEIQRKVSIISMAHRTEAQPDNLSIFQSIQTTDDLFCGWSFQKMAHTGVYLYTSNEHDMIV